MNAVCTMDALLARPARLVSNQPHCVALSSTLSRDTTKLCQRGEWEDRMLVETVLSMLTLVAG
jgi:hypothetical protein